MVTDIFICTKCLYCIRLNHLAAISQTCLPTTMTAKCKRTNLIIPAWIGWYIYFLDWIFSPRENRFVGHPGKYLIQCYNISPLQSPPIKASNIYLWEIRRFRKKLLFCQDHRCPHKNQLIHINTRYEHFK